MSKNRLILMGFLAGALHVFAVVPTNGLPILMRSGDYEVSVSPSLAWTPLKYLL